MALLHDHVKNIFSKEVEMLKSIDRVIRPGTRNFISEKIGKQMNTLLKIADTELKEQEKINSATPPVMDENYFNKKRLNRNNI
jgi:hypothetical protein